MFVLSYACPICNHSWDEKPGALDRDPYTVTASCPSCALQKIEPHRVVNEAPPLPESPFQGKGIRKLGMVAKEQLRTPLTIAMSVALNRMVAMLNSALLADPIGISKLFGIRMPCSEALINHASVQVSMSDTPASVRMIGIVNALADSVIGLTANERYARACEKAEQLQLEAFDLQTELYTMSSGYICEIWDDETNLIKEFKLFDPVRNKPVDFNVEQSDQANNGQPPEELESSSNRATSLDPSAVSLPGRLDTNPLG